MSQHDYIPGPDLQFHEWANNFYNYALLHFTPWQAPSPQTSIGALIATFNEAFIAAQDRGKAQRKRLKDLAPRAKDFTNKRAYRNRPLSEADKETNRRKSKIRARVEHPFLVLKRLWGFAKVHEKIREGASKFIDDALVQIRQGCFVAGTLVHTRDGLKPIEDIKVGDYVLSKHESGEGELCYQPVTRTYEYENREVYYLGLSVLKEQPEGEEPAWEYDCVAVTAGHPIWVKEMRFWRGLSAEMERRYEEIRDIHAWMTVGKLWQMIWEITVHCSKEGLTLPIHIELADGRNATISGIAPILQSKEMNDGVMFSY